MYKLFSQRLKEQNGEISDVYTYYDFPESFRNQFLHIVGDVFSQDNFQRYFMFNRYHEIDLWNSVCCAFAREKGLKAIYSNNNLTQNNETAYKYYVDKATNEDFLDIMDFTINNCFSKDLLSEYMDARIIDNAIEELNYRFKQHMLGYEVIGGNLIVKSNEHIHQNIVKPAISLLHNEQFSGAEEEFFKAFDCYKQQNNKDAIINLAKSFESVLKVICKEMNYSFDDKKDTAKDLLKILKDNNYYPSYLENHLTGVRTTLESGLPTVRNKLVAHGQGSDIVKIPNEYVEYAINLVSTNIVFLVNLYEKKVKDYESTNKEEN